MIWLRHWHENDLKRDLWLMTQKRDQQRMLGRELAPFDADYLAALEAEADRRLRAKEGRT